MRRLGLDLDNTLIRYDDAFAAAAVARGLLAPGAATGKRAVKAAVVAARDEPAWQALQGHVYGAGLGAASLYPGVEAFLARAAAAGVALSIVSHKTRYGHFDPARVDLREAATAFLAARGVDRFVRPERVFYCATREEKLARVAAERFDAFVDDLEEVLLDPAFPAATTTPVLFAPDGDAREGASDGRAAALTRRADWAGLAELLLGPPAA